MFAAIMSDQQLFTLYSIGAFLVVAPAVIGLAALTGYVLRVSQPPG